MKKFLCTLAVTLFCAVTAIAQESMQEVVYLKNGTVLKGTIVEYVLGESIKIKTTDGVTVDNKIADVTKITRQGEEIKVEKSIAIPITTIQPQTVVTSSVETTPNAAIAPQSRINPQGSVDNTTKLYITSLELGGAFGDQLTTFSFAYIGRFNIIPEFSIGVGLGLSSVMVKEYWDTPTIAVPTFISLRSNLLRSKVSPYVSVDFGGVGLFSTSSYGGSSYEVYFNPMAGVDVKLKNHKSIYLGVGYLSMGMGAGAGQCCLKLGFNL